MPPYRCRIMLAMPGQSPVEFARFDHLPAEADLAGFIRDLAPEWIVTIERTLLDSALLSPRPRLTRHYVASGKDSIALPTSALGPVIDRYIDQGSEG